jgi:hypothetical protein
MSKDKKEDKQQKVPFLDKKGYIPSEELDISNPPKGDPGNPDKLSDTEKSNNKK